MSDASSETTSQTVQHWIPVEGVDLLTLAGVGDAHLQELAKVCGCRVILRDDHLILSGELPKVEACVPIAQHLVDLARMGVAFGPGDIRRFARQIEAKPESPAPVVSAHRIVLPGTRKIIVPKSDGQRLYLDAIAKHDIVVGVGPAGTGKTYLAVAEALDALYKKRVRRIVLARPAVEAGEQLGFLPGRLEEKVDPYLRPLYDALEDMLPYDRIRRAIEERTIEIAPLAYMRGRTLADAFVILDEAQNATRMQMKMFLTRLGLNSRAVVTADKTQIDLPQRDESGLLEIERILRGIEGIEFVYLTEQDVVRHRLVKEIIRAYAEAGGGSVGG
ncbi:MAG: PhoH family protein, partial [Gemmatimonadetes bacterium]|nr:PhoH family protein [Gemmatimonadota bacterium]